MNYGNSESAIRTVQVSVTIMSLSYKVFLIQKNQAIVNLRKWLHLKLSRQPTCEKSCVKCLLKEGDYAERENIFIAENKCILIIRL